jgi:cytochrome c-type biogenesis protein CcmH
MKQTIIVKQMVIWIALLVCVLSAPNSAWAQTPTDGPTVNDVAKYLYCPLCSGLTVDVCELQVCDDMREVITDKLAAGENPEQIQAYFLEQYGQKVLGKPSTEGFHLTAWLMPFIGLFAAALILFFWLRNRNPSSVSFASTSPVPAVPVDEYNDRLEQELKRVNY